jgi:hypothetical protein
LTVLSKRSEATRPSPWVNNSPLGIRVERVARRNWNPSCTDIKIMHARASSTQSVGELAIGKVKRGSGVAAQRCLSAAQLAHALVGVPRCYVEIEFAEAKEVGPMVRIGTVRDARRDLGWMGSDGSRRTFGAAAECGWKMVVCSE